MKVKIDTEIGKMTAVIEKKKVNAGTTICIGHLEERPTIAVESDTVDNAIYELQKSLKIILLYEKNKTKKK